MTEMSPAEEVFFAALEKAPADRPAYLDAACAGKPELRARVEKLLAAHPKVGGFLEPPAGGDATGTFAAGDPDPTASHRPAGEAVGVVVAGRYKLLQQIGEGGMGTVWMADQTEPVKRRVAVKLIRVEKSQSRTILSRFEAERQAIALMDHPHIAKLLDAGTTDGGSPFFVMELVKGVPLTEFCDAHRLAVPDRLKLFVQICSAVQHAHQKGVIHRDLKPSNILVESHDGTPVPKVIDFGLAKATTGLHLSDHTLFTAFGSVMGTPLYMAPEQAAFNAVDVDTRADVYALGVLLYELLTGTTPIERETLRKAALDEMLRLVREQDPPTPSSRLSSGEGRPAVAANRQTEPAKLGRLVKGELDCIVLKALAKERDRRYESATGFAKDVERFLNHEPVAAGPPGAGYRVRKFVRRNRGPVAAAGVVLLALVLGAAGTTWGMVRADRSRVEAERERQNAVAAAETERAARQAEADQRAAAEKAAAAEAVAKEVAQKRLAQVEKGVDLMTGIFADLDGHAVRQGTKPLAAVLADRLVRAADQLDGEAVGDPLAVAGLQGRLGQSLHSLGFPAQAVTLLEKSRATQAALSPADDGYLTTLNNLAVAYADAGRLADAIAVHEECLRRTRAARGPDHADSLASMSNLAAVYNEAGRRAEAVVVLEECLRRTRAARGPDHADTLWTLHNLAVAYTGGGRAEDAAELLKGAVPLAQQRLGRGHGLTISMLNSLAGAYRATGRVDKAVPLHEEALRRARASHGSDHPYTLNILDNLALAYRDAGRAREAMPLLEECVRGRMARLGPTHADTLASRDELMNAYLAAGQGEKALPLIGEFLASERKQLGAGTPGLAGQLARVSTELLKVGQFAAAEPVLRECLAIREKVMPDMWLTFNTRSQLGGSLLGQGKPAEAEPLLLAGYEGMKQRAKTIPPEARDRLAEAADRLVELYVALNKPDEAAKWRAERATYPPPVAPPPRPAK